MKNKTLFLVILLAVIGYLYDNSDFITSRVDHQHNDIKILYRAIDKKQSDMQVSGTGIVTKILADDLKGSRHQKFIVKLPNGATLLISHNIDLASRIDSLKEGDTLDFYGEYEWNSRGGVVHWTHHDPKGHHPHGWLKHNGRLYQ